MNTVWKNNGEQMKRTAIFCTLLILLLTAAKTSRSEPGNSPVPGSFDGFFRQAAYGRGKPNANSPISSSFMFQEGGNGSKYAVYIPFYLTPSLKYEYKIQGVSVRQFLPENAKDEDYRRIIQTTWPNYNSNDIKQAVKTVKDWIKKNPDIPLLLVNSSRRAESLIKFSEYNRRGKHVQEGKLIKQVSPEYPANAALQQIGGAIEFELVIDEYGIVEQIQVIQGDSRFIPAAIEAVRQWRYSPTLIDGEAFAFITKVEMSFDYTVISVNATFDGRITDIRIGN